MPYVRLIQGDLRLTLLIYLAMYTDIDSNNRISIHNLTAEEALLISMSLSGESICITKPMLDLSAELLKNTQSVLNDPAQNLAECSITTTK